MFRGKQVVVRKFVRRDVCELMDRDVGIEAADRFPSWEVGIDS